MNTTTKFVLNLLMSTALAVFTASFLFGWGEFTDKLGGVKSFAGLIALLVMGAVIVGGIVYLQRTSYADRTSAMVRDAIVATVAVVVLSAIGYNWIDLPTGAGLKILLVMIACAVVAAAATIIGYVEDE